MMTQRFPFGELPCYFRTCCIHLLFPSRVYSDHAKLSREPTTGNQDLFQHSIIVADSRNGSKLPKGGNEYTYRVDTDSKSANGSPRPTTHLDTFKCYPIHTLIAFFAVPAQPLDITQCFFHTVHALHQAANAPLPFHHQQTKLHHYCDIFKAVGSGDIVPQRYNNRSCPTAT